MGRKQVTENKPIICMKNDFNPENFRNYLEEQPEGENNIENIDSGYLALAIQNQEFDFDENAKDEGYESVEVVTSEIKRVFSEDKNLMTKLIKFAESYIYVKTGSLEICGFKGSDIVMEAIEGILKLKRKWYRQKCSNIVVLIMGVIVSIIRNRINSKSYKESEKVIPLFPPDDEKNNSVNSVYDDENANKGNYNDSSVKESDEEYYNRILSEFEDDEIAYCIIDELLSRGDYDIKEQNQLLAKNLGITVKEVEKAKKRIKRKLIILKRY